MGFRLFYGWSRRAAAEDQAVATLRFRLRIRGKGSLFRNWQARNEQKAMFGGFGHRLCFCVVAAGTSAGWLVSAAKKGVLPRILMIRFRL